MSRFFASAIVSVYLSLLYSPLLLLKANQLKNADTTTNTTATTVATNTDHIGRESNLLDFLKKKRQDIVLSEIKRKNARD